MEITLAEMVQSTRGFKSISEVLNIGRDNSNINRALKFAFIDFPCKSG